MIQEIAGFTAPYLNNGLDYALLALLAWGTLRGLRDGFARAIVSLVGLVVAWFVAGKFTGQVVEWVAGLQHPVEVPPAVMAVLAFLALFFATRLLFQLVGNILQGIADFGPLLPLNRLAGAIFGLARQGVILALCFGLLSPVILLTNLPWLVETVNESAIASSLISGFYTLTPLVLRTFN